jgi:ABC-2 type transport system ATP-binding protein
MTKRTRVAHMAVVLLAAVGAGGAVAAGSGTGTSVRTQVALVEVPGGPTSATPARIDTTLYVPSTATASHPAPAVVLSPGFGQSKTAVDGDARALAGDGYVVLAWSLRGFGRSTGRIALDAPDTEVRDLSVLLDRLAQTPEVLKDGPGDPRVGLAGASYGGGLSLMGATYDRRVDATVPIITWNSLTSAFLPGGVFKAQYASVFFASGPGGPCARFAQRVCEAYTRLAQTATGTPSDLALLARSSPDPTRITAPTLLIQGQDDTLFPLTESLTTALALQTKGTPVSLAWLNGGHDKPFDANGDATIRTLTRTWFDRYLRRDTSVQTGPVFRWDRSTGGTASSNRLPAGSGAPLPL